MEFLQPLALAGLAAAALPALLHLLQRRLPPTQVFPAVRYLVDAEQRHSRRLRMRNLLLLLLRTALVLAVVLAAARPVVSAPFGGAHAPSAVAIVLDNSLSAGAIVDGRPRIAALRDAAVAVASAAGAGDRLWLITADAIPRQLVAGDAVTAVRDIEVMPTRLDLGDAVRAAAEAVRRQPLPGTIVVLSDFQRTALSDAGVDDVPVVGLAPAPPPPNRGVVGARAEPGTWAGGGVVVADIGGSDAEPGEVTLELPGGVAGRGLAGPGGTAALEGRDLAPGWHAVRVLLSPDELRADDVRYLAVRSRPPAAANTAGAGRFTEAALAVLVETGRLRTGTGVLVADRPGPGKTILVPPADPARVAAVNQALATRGVGLRYGEERVGEWGASSDLLDVDGVTVRRRYEIRGEGTPLAAAGAEPWIVEAGSVVVAGSRFEEAWTDLPVQPAFLPLMDALVNRVGAGAAWTVEATPGAPVRVPPDGRRVLTPDGPRPVPPDGVVSAPAAPGAYFVTGATGDTIGALLVNVDGRESDLRVADEGAARGELGGDVRFGDAAAVVAGAFAARRAELTSGLLWLAVALAVAELALATFGGAVRRGTD